MATISQSDAYALYSPFFILYISTTTNPCDFLPFWLPKIVLEYFSPFFETFGAIYQDGIIFGIFCADQNM
jgi:hypothetical protein